MSKKITKEQVLKLAGISQATMYRKIKEGKFPDKVEGGRSDKRPSLWQRSDVEAWLRQNKLQKTKDVKKVNPNQEYLNQVYEDNILRLGAKIQFIENKIEEEVRKAQTDKKTNKKIKDIEEKINQHKNQIDYNRQRFESDGAWAKNGLREAAAAIKEDREYMKETRASFERFSEETRACFKEIEKQLENLKKGHWELTNRIANLELKVASIKPDKRWWKKRDNNV